MRNPFPAQDPLTATLQHVLRPIVRLFIARGIPFPVLVETLKRLFVEVADEQFGQPGVPQTDSRISLLTGVHRKDVKRLRGQHAIRGELPPPSVSLGEKIVASWIGNGAFVDRQGQARPLPRLASRGDPESFEALVASVSKDIRARTVLEEWMRLGIVHVDGDDRVWLNSDAFVPRAGEDEMRFYFGNNLHDHIAGAVHNLLGEQPPFLERSVHYSGLSLEAVQALATLSERAGMQALKAVNREARARSEEDPPEQRRFTFGVYFYSEPSGSDGSDDSEPAKPAP